MGRHSGADVHDAHPAASARSTPVRRTAAPAVSLPEPVDSARPRATAGRSTAGRSTAGRAKQTASVLFAFAAAVSFFLVNIVDPYSGATASGERSAPARFGGAAAQTMEVAGDYRLSVTQESYHVEKKPEEPVANTTTAAWAPPAVTPDPGSAQAYAAVAVAARGWPSTEFDCLVALWAKESGWRVNAYNGSGAYGIPQALPGSKMASAGADWETNAATQIEWGLGYVQGRYGTPCAAWAHSEDSGWY